MKKSLMVVAALVLTNSIALAAQEPDPKNLKCVVQEIEMYQTKAEEVISEKTIVPDLYAGRTGTDGKEIFKRGNISIVVILSNLRYTPLVSTYVQVGKVSIDTNLTASVRDPSTGNQIIATCTYDKGE